MLEKRPKRPNRRREKSIKWSRRCSRSEVANGLEVDAANCQAATGGVCQWEGQDGRRGWKNLQLQ